MRLSTRFGLVAALAVLPLLGVLGYAIAQLRSFARTNERLATRQLVGVRIASGVSGRLPILEEFQNKYAVSRDDGYAAKYRQTARAIGTVLDELDAVQTSPDERDALDALTMAWHALDAGAGPVDASHAADLPRAFAQLQELALEVSRRTKAAVRAEVEDAREAREQTQRVATGVALLAMLTSLALLVWAVRALRRRLGELTEATEAVSRGRFTYRMPTTGNDELGRVAESFNRMVSALSQLDRMKEDFVSSVSHELRTPIVAMQETNNVLLDDVPGPLTPQQRRMLELNSQAAERLSTMIGDLLDLGRVRAGIRYRMARHPLAALTRSATSEFEALALDRGIHLTVDAEDGMDAHCDPDRYVQVVQNLVENALKHTPPGGRVAVTLRSVLVRGLSERADIPDDYEGCCALLTVADDGTGIASDDHDRVFDKFFRRQGHSSDAGVGLGLAICREIVAAHRGAIWVDTAAIGATLRVALPCESTKRGRR